MVDLRSARAFAAEQVGRSQSLISLLHDHVEMDLEEDFFHMTPVYIPGQGITFSTFPEPVEDRRRVVLISDVPIQMSPNPLDAQSTRDGVRRCITAACQAFKQTYQDQDSQANIDKLCEDFLNFLTTTPAIRCVALCTEPVASFTRVYPFLCDGSRRPGFNGRTIYPSKILPGLYLSSSLCASTPKVMKDLNITHILNVTTECDLLPAVESLISMYKRFPIEDSLVQAVTLPDLHDCLAFIHRARTSTVTVTTTTQVSPGLYTHCQVPEQVDTPGQATDNKSALSVPDISPHEDRAIHAAHSTATCIGSVLVHCQAGRSRSGMIVVAYLMMINDWSVERALAFIKERRPIAQPNESFLEQLRHRGSTIRNMLPNILK
eukprot:TRINITY_DN41676_c0_g1_i1.p1 TRINITY_DN41676_c0_g1~~TRINITY_DN41676_c0_g1_i1.p1  ORF type:complete len:409 (-),score=55.32 TRINITY_DN41676_c0_g1_i1:288-1418(-)